MKALYTLVIGPLLLLSSPEAGAFVSFTGDTYSENFDSLGGNPWVNGSTLPGWYAYVSQVRTGSSIASGQPDAQWGPVSSYSGAVYNNSIYDRYGKSTGQSTPRSLLNLGTSDGAGDRSLGSQNGSADDVVFALVLRNDSGSTIPSVELSFVGQQWQINDLSSHPSMTLDFSYGTFSSFDASWDSPNTVTPSGFYNGYTNPTGGEFDFSAMHFGSTNGPLNGQATANSQTLAGSLDVNWDPGEYLVLRWFDDYFSTEPSAMLAIDDLQITAVPEPASGVLLIGGLASLLLWRKPRCG